LVQPQYSYGGPFFSLKYSFHLEYSYKCIFGLRPKKLRTSEDFFKVLCSNKKEISNKLRLRFGKKQQAKNSGDFLLKIRTIAVEFSNFVNP